MRIDYAVIRRISREIQNNHPDWDYQDCYRIAEEQVADEQNSCDAWTEDDL